MEIAKCTVEGKAEVVKALEQHVKVSQVHLCCVRWVPALSALHICKKAFQVWLCRMNVLTICAKIEKSL